MCVQVAYCFPNWTVCSFGKTEDMLGLKAKVSYSFAIVFVILALSLHCTLVLCIMAHGLWEVESCTLGLIIMAH